MSRQNYRISLDAMSGDHGPSVVVAAALDAIAEFPDIELVLVGDEASINAQLAGAVPDRLRVHHATQVVTMEDAPAQALRSKKDSSMRVAINLVKEGVVDAAVSAGNTGALMATAKFVLKTLPGISRPAICTAVPAGSAGHTHILDLGANIDSSPEQLHQFAVMGSVMVQAVDENPQPRVGLLNVGAEAIKGSADVKAAGELLSASPLNYIGFVEGDDIYSGTVDVVVCDGFVGNVALKTSEGLAKMISTNLRDEFLKNPLTKLAGLLSMPVLKAFRRKIDPRRYNGASLLGLNGIVIKSHGGADRLSFANAIKIARIEARQQVPAQIGKQIRNLLPE
jgi:glycerol-3-phosphate acyltransferase PlsX